jgi:16S rRNA (uracil1498-N3)-methyltransferase
MDPDKSLPGRHFRDRQLRRFFAGPEQFQGDEVVLSPSETHHLIRVLRLPLGDRVEISDGCGRIYAAEISHLEPTAARLHILSELDNVLESNLQIMLGLALVRSETFDLIVRQVTEMGIFRLIPFLSARSLIRPEGWKKTRQSRWLRLAQEALKSSQRKVLPQILEPVDFLKVLEGPEDLKLMFWEEQREHDCKVDLASWPRPQSVRALIGPEGGFTATEAAAAQNAGFLLMGLGPRRLRVETAAMAAVTVLQYLWGDLGT